VIRCNKQLMHIFQHGRFSKKQMQLNSSSVIMRRQYSISNDTSQPISICYFSSISPLDPFTQLAGTCWRCLHCHPSLADMLQLVRTICLEQVTAIHPISQQFQLIQISSKSPSVCSSLISTLLARCSCSYLFTFLLSSQIYLHIRLKSTF